MRTLFIRRCPDHNALLRFALGLCAAVLIVLLLVLPDDAEAANGFLWDGNCYSAQVDAYNAFMQAHQHRSYVTVGSIVYQFRNFRANDGFWYREIETVDLATGNTTLVAMKQIQYGSENFYSCVIPDDPTGLAGNGVPSVFSPIYEMARTLVNTQELMIFLWAVATFFLGFKFGYFVFNSGGGKHDTF